MIFQRHVALNFHGIGTPHDGVETDERPFWLSATEFEDIVERVAARSDRARYTFTFDDGNASDLTAADILARRGFTGRFYILTGRLDRPHYLTCDDVRELRRMGMTIGLHGRDHLDWRRLDDAGLALETVEARRHLAGVVAAPVDEVAVPFGAYDRRVFGWLWQHGFARVLTSDGGTFRPRDRVWNRTSVRRSMIGPALDTIIEARPRPILAARRAARLLVNRRLR